MPLDLRSVLSNQVGNVLGQVKRERERIAHNGPEIHVGDNGSDRRLSLPVVPLQTELANIHGDLEALSERVAGAADFRTAFEDLQALRDRAQNLFGECLALATAPVVRAQNLDHGACATADRLLCEIGEVVGVHWSHFTILAESEFLGKSSQFVRLRYPATSIWQLPIAVHELGHFCGPNWPASRHGDPYVACMAQTDLGPENYREEYFADLFAVYVLGIPYACACLLERFQPLQRDTSTHPADAKRAVWILKGLELLAKESRGESARIARGRAGQLRDVWAAIAAYGVSVSPEDAARLGQIALQIWGRFVRSRPGAMYGDLRGALALVADYTRRDGRGGPAASLRDVVAASWLVRLDLGSRNGGDELPALEQWAARLCRD